MARETNKIKLENAKKSAEQAEALRKQREADDLKKQQEEAQGAQKPQQEPQETQKPSDNTSTDQNQNPDSGTEPNSNSDGTSSSSTKGAPEPLNQPITPLLMCDFACKKSIVGGIDMIIGGALAYYGYQTSATPALVVGGLAAVGAIGEMIFGSQYTTSEAFKQQQYVSSPLTSVFINTALLGLAAYGTGTLSAIPTSIAVVAIPVATAIVLKAYSSENEDINSMSEMFKEASIINAESIVDAGATAISTTAGGIYYTGASVINFAVDVVSGVAGGIYSVGASLGNGGLYVCGALHDSFYDAPEIH